MITILLSLQGFPHSWGFSMTIYKTFEKDFSQIGANLHPELYKTKSLKTKGGDPWKKRKKLKKVFRFGQE